jgi:hypothetical protein
MVQIGKRAIMPTSEEERTYLESLIREDFERCHPCETLERRASFSKEDRGLLRDWMAIAARRAAVDQAKRLTSTAEGADAWSRRFLRPHARAAYDASKRGHARKLGVFSAKKRAQLC